MYLQHKIYCPDDERKAPNGRSNRMKSPAQLVLSLSVFLATPGIAPGQAPPPAVDEYLAAAKIAAGTD